MLMTLLVGYWLGIRFVLLTSVIVVATAIVSVLNANLNASLVGFSLTFASAITEHMLFAVRELAHHCYPPLTYKAGTKICEPGTSNGTQFFAVPSFITV
jgi:hypothetical protein